LLAFLLVLLWGALAVWIFSPDFQFPFFGASTHSSADDVSSLFHIPGVAIRLEKCSTSETYRSFSKRLGVSEAALRSLNQANDTTEPTVNGRLLVPSKDGVFHWVAAGQGLSDIARAYGLPLGDVLSANHKGSADGLKAGEVLYLPGGTYLSKTDPQWQALTKLISDAGFQKPTTGRFADGFGMRVHPITGKTVFHAGLDLAPGAGCKVFATQGGQVSFAGIRAGYGLLVIIDHGEGLTSYYAHLSDIRVSVQQRVLKGDWIGRVGATGNVTGPHLHFEIRKNGKPQNPLLYLEK
jgi:murein DD-endopeptidase MepM/ murein hydrolase activator NlpD